MKHIYLICLILFPITLSAQTLHTIICTDTQDKEIGIAARASHDNYSLDFLNTIETSLKSLYNISEPIDLKGYDCNKRDVLQALNNLTCEAYDIVIFIYIGHGARGINDWSDFPQMCFATPAGSVYRNPEEFYPLENVRDIIMTKGPRLCLVIGDCCNSDCPALSTKSRYDGVTASATDVRRQEREDIIRQLFLTKKGSIILTASVKGQYGWCSNEDPVKGMFLEKNLNDVFYDIIEGKASYTSWNDLLSRVRTNTYNYSKNFNLTTSVNGRIVNWTQTPFYSVDITDVPTVDIRKKIIEPTYLQQALEQVADSRTFSDTERIAKSRRVKSDYFDGNNAIVEVVGKDRVTVLQTMKIDRYLLRISTENDLATITVIDTKTDNNGKINYLKVHEIYIEPSNY